MQLRSCAKKDFVSLDQTPRRIRSLSTKAQPQASDTNNSHLLALPAEMRNIIYRYVLVEQSAIRCTANTELPTEPGLLRTCRGNSQVTCRLRCQTDHHLQKSAMKPPTSTSRRTFSLSTWKTMKLDSSFGGA